MRLGWMVASYGVLGLGCKEGRGIFWAGCIWFGISKKDGSCFGDPHIEHHNL